MGEYARIEQQIENYKKEKSKLIEQKEQLAMNIYEIDISIGECEGALAELRSIDGEEY